MFGHNNMKPKIATVEETGEPFSLLKHQPAVEITHKLQAYHKAKEAELPNDYKPSPEDLLNIMLPPREWKNQNNQYFMQYVSHSRTGRDDIERVQKSLQNNLLNMQARTEGICPIRQHLFSQLFDQVIRQVSLDSPERGLMLLRVRDERKMTIAAHETLFHSGISYGLQKQLESEEGMQELEKELQSREMKKKYLEKKLVDLMSKKESMELKVRERKTMESEKREFQLKALINQNQNLEKFLKKKRKIQPIKEEPAPKEEVK